MTQTRGLRSFLIAVSALAVVSIVRLALPTGLTGQYFLDARLSGAPAFTTRDSTFSGLQMSRRWSFRPPAAFSAQWSGYLQVNRPGLYTFVLRADDGSQLYVDEQPIVIEQGQGPGERTGEIRLEQGAHRVLLQYFQTGGAYQFAWLWKRDEGALEPVPAWALSPRSRGASAVFALRALNVIWLLVLAETIALGLRFVYTPWYWATRRSELGEGQPANYQPRLMTRPRALALLAMFLLLTAVHTWPLVTSPAHLSRNDNSDTMLNEWAIAWIAHQLPRDPLHLFDANIFYPEKHTLAYSEPLIVQGLLAAPLIWLGASPVLAYNILLLSGLALTGWTMAMLVARWTGDDFAGTVAGMIFAFNAHTLTRLPHLQAQHAEFLPLALLCLDQLLRQRRWSSAYWLAIWFVLQSMTSLHLLVMTAIVLSAATLARPEAWLGTPFRELAPKLLVVAVVAGLALTPMLIPYWQLRAGGFERSLDEVAYFSANASDYWTTPSRLHAWLGTSARGATSLFPGVAALVLAGLALTGREVALRDPRVRMTVVFGIVGVILSFGPIVPGYAFVYTMFPPLQAVRAAARFGYIGIVAVAILAGFGLSALRRQWRERRGLQSAATAVFAALVFLETVVAPIRYEPFSSIPAIYDSSELKTADAVAELPFPPADVVSRNAAFMLGSTRNFRPLVNGYSGFIPPSYFAHYVQLAGFPDDEAIEVLKALGVSHVIVHLAGLSTEQSAGLAATPRLQEVESDGRIAIYRVVQ
jgi:PA14 domain-containing protein